MIIGIVLLLFLKWGVESFKITLCNKTDYYEPSRMSCQACPSNASMIATIDGFSCMCKEHSVPAGIARCRECNATEVVSADGTACVPRKCQRTSGRFVCRKCPSDYISVTQNLDGSPTKEVQCIKCARGYKAVGNTCVRCAECACARTEVPTRGACLPRKYVRNRPAYHGDGIHSAVLMDVVKYEYLCMNGDLVFCRLLASECVKNFYMADVAGPCRFWVQPKLTPNGLPDLIIKQISADLKPDEFILPRGKESISLSLAAYTADGAFRILETSDERLHPCSLPIHVKIGTDFAYDCVLNTTKLILSTQNTTYAPFVDINGNLKPLPVLVRKPNDYYVQRETWNNRNFRRYFVINSVISPSTNVTGIVYQSAVFIRIRIERVKLQSSSLRLQISFEVHYATKSPPFDSIKTSLTVRHEMPSAGILRGLEVWGGVLGSLMSLYAIVQWRGELRRGGLNFSFVPQMAGAVSDALFFAAWFSTLHVLAAEAGTLGMTLPLSRSEEIAIRAFVFSAVSLKAIKVAWLNWKQCKVDIFLLDWSKYNTSIKDNTQDNNDWRRTALSREWTRLQTQRRVIPSYTVVLTLFVLQVTSPWQDYLPTSQGYRWAVAITAWLASYCLLFGLRWFSDRFTGSPFDTLIKVCKGTGISLLVFQEEFYAHYVHGRNEDSKELRLIAGPVAMCRIVMAAPLRIAFKQLSSPGIDDLGDIYTRRAMLTKLLATFFERALDGLNWVACERTLPERLLDIELTERESGTTSVLLYDSEERCPSCLAVTWWGEEWSIGMFEAMLFGVVVLATNHWLLAAFITLAQWQVMKLLRLYFGNRNHIYKTGVESII